MVLTCLFTLIKAQCPRVSAEDYEPGAQMSSERESQKESGNSLDQIHVHCRKQNNSKVILRDILRIVYMILYNKRIISEGKWMLYLKSLLEQCCLQTGS